MASGPSPPRSSADQGADVIKVEAPGRGDGLRQDRPEPRRTVRALREPEPQQAIASCSTCASPRGVEILDRLVEGADVFVQNFRPGAVDRMGIGADRYRALHPDLVYVSISGFGETGPDGPSRGLRLGDAGLLRAWRCTRPTSRPASRPSSAASSATRARPIQTSQLITAALLARARGAGGQHLRVSMLHASLAFLWPDGMQNHTLLGARRLGAAIEVGAPDDPADPRWTHRDQLHPGSRVQGALLGDRARGARERRALRDGRIPGPRHARELQALLEDTLRQHTTAELASDCSRPTCPSPRSATLRRSTQDPQVIANDLLFEMDHPVAGRIRQPRPLGTSRERPSKCDAARPASASTPPRSPARSASTAIRSHGSNATGSWSTIRSRP